MIDLLGARMWANAGTSGFFGKGDMQKEFEEASFNLKPGEISPVVQTASGLHLIERYVEDIVVGRLCGMARGIAVRGCGASCVTALYRYPG